MSSPSLLGPLPNTLPLSDVLARLGWRHEPGHENAQGRVVYDDRGECLGQMTANSVWLTLRERGLVTSAEVA